ncbi:prenyltransferase [Candidatus Methylomirabilis lanthanidiphila]|uniref:4-hydroxybenzoate polyprenyltransferase n=1 Tax=Candidatus Methylomirabilis lanthanidiphila TaxID=2211376 RepID=A0A564ZFK7_9BACT|nr:putative 4-hydroxybenzoate polyprenyltransferase [Candidatus Methylomirabilis lanthanidiphila]VUZ83926.1 prenyltransferase [Candidatus Methylomirabilis lanthanidiphila]
MNLLQPAIRKTTLFLELIKFSHTVFALPFAFMGAILAARGIPTPPTVFWIVVAMVGARSGAMAINRLADQEFDARNPRTQERALPKGLVKRGEVIVFMLGSFALFLFAASRLNPLCLKLAPLAMAVLILYSYTKRFTFLSHLMLGLALAIAPLGAWIAVTGEMAAVPVVLGLAVLFWVAGFDILYAMADIDFDRVAGLYSIPARFGVPAGMAISRSLHAATLMLLFLLMFLSDLRSFYLAGVLLATGLLVYEHVLLHRYGLKRLDAAFFTANGLLSISLFGFTLLDVLLLS